MTRLISVTVDGLEITVEQLADGTFRKPAYLAGAERAVVGPKRYADGTVGHWGVSDKYAQDSHTKGLTAGVPKLETAPATPEAAQWEGWNTSLRPAQEPIIVARKPLTGKTVAANVMEHGTGALNIGATRTAAEANRPNPRVGGGQFMFDGFTTEKQLVEAAERGEETPKGRDAAATLERWREWQAGKAERGPAVTSEGRWPANVVLVHAASCRPPGVCDESCPVREMDRQSGTSKSPGTYQRSTVVENKVYGASNDRPVQYGHGDEGGASRFFPSFRYQAKAPSRERPRVNGVAHVSVKPLELMKWLVRLVCPPGGTILEPFAGSGTTVEASILEGFRVIAVEREPDYLPLIAQRIERANTTLAEQAAAAEKEKRPTPPRAQTRPKRNPAPAPVVDLPGQDMLPFEVA